MAVVLNGKNLRDIILDKLALEINKFDKKPKLVVILVGNDPASELYVNNKKKIAKRVGIDSEILHYENDVDEKTLINKINELNNDKNVNAILVQLPLPEHINKEHIIENISPCKDVDGFTTFNAGKLYTGKEPIVYPCTPQGILFLLDEYKINLEGKHAVVIGRSNIVGRPIAQMLLNKNATVTICHSYTKNLRELTKKADIIISAVGKNILNSEMIKENSVIIDVGIFKTKEGKLSGDVDFESCSKVASYISPVPGGVGPMTIASLMVNTYKLCMFQNNL